ERQRHGRRRQRNLQDPRRTAARTPADPAADDRTGTHVAAPPNPPPLQPRPPPPRPPHPPPPPPARTRAPPPPPPPPRPPAGPGPPPGSTQVRLALGRPPGPDPDGRGNDARRGERDRGDPAPQDADGRILRRRVRADPGQERQGARDAHRQQLRRLPADTEL